MKSFNFLTFIEPFLSYIDSGKLFRKPFSWLYMAFAAINVIIPFYVLYMAISSNMFSYSPAKLVIAFIIVWLFIVAACWVGVQIWWNRSQKVQETSKEGDEFPATPVISHFIQTWGEWYGSFIAIVGVGISLCTVIFDAGSLSYALGLPLGFVNYGLLGIVLCPVIGFVIVVVFRFFAEMSRGLAAIANNTKGILNKY